MNIVWQRRTRLLQATAALRLICLSDALGPRCLSSNVDHYARMKQSTKPSVLMLIGSAFLMLGVFARPLGIPSGLDSRHENQDMKTWSI